MERILLIAGLTIFTALSLGCSASPGDAAPPPEVEAASGHSDWITDFEKAKAEAGKRNVPIVADFSGSDWCGWCIKLDKEVFAKPAFQDYAKESLVLFLADFPRKKLSPELTAQNEKLARLYGVQGFPTVLLLDATGKELARTGYRRGGPEKYVDHLKGLIEEHWKPTPQAPATP